MATLSCTLVRWQRWEPFSDGDHSPSIIQLLDVLPPKQTDPLHFLRRPLCGEHSHTLCPLSKQIFLWTQLGHHCCVDMVDIVAAEKIDLLCRPMHPTVSMGYVVVLVGIVLCHYLRSLPQCLGQEGVEPSEGRKDVQPAQPVNKDKSLDMPFAVYISKICFS